MKVRNPVAKHARKYNKSVVMVDRKKAAKRGYAKHKQDKNVANCGRPGLGERAICIPLEELFKTVVYDADKQRYSFITGRSRTDFAPSV